MLRFFWICLSVGACVTLLNGLLGLVLHVLDLDIDWDWDLDFALDLGSFLPLRPSLWFLWLTVLGATGVICYGNWHWRLWVALLLGLGLSFGVVYVINHFLLRPLKKCSNEETAGRQDCVGLTAKVTERIFPNAFGRVTLTVQDNTLSVPAKSVRGDPVDVGTCVLITEVDHQIFYVDPMPNEENK